MLRLVELPFLASLEKDINENEALVHYMLMQNTIQARIKGYSKLTLGGDGQYCLIVCIATLSNSIYGVDREVVGSVRLQTSHSKG